MVTLNRIYTRTGDGGDTRLATGQTVKKFDLRVEAYGAVDETNATLGLVRLHTGADPDFDQMLERIQNELFDLGADLATPGRDDRGGDGQPLGWTPLRMIDSQVERLEGEIDRLNAELSPLNSFVLPAGTPVATYLHLARTVCRRAERVATALAAQDVDVVGPAALKYLNRLSDLLFVMARYANGRGGGDVLWRPGATR